MFGNRSPKGNGAKAFDRSRLTFGDNNWNPVSRPASAKSRRERSRALCSLAADSFLSHGPIREFYLALSDQSLCLTQHLCVPDGRLVLPFFPAKVFPQPFHG